MIVCPICRDDDAVRSGCSTCFGVGKVDPRRESCGPGRWHGAALPGGAPMNAGLLLFLFGLVLVVAKLTDWLALPWLVALIPFGVILFVIGVGVVVDRVEAAEREQ